MKLSVITSTILSHNFGLLILAIYKLLRNSRPLFWESLC